MRSRSIFLVAVFFSAVATAQETSKKAGPDMQAGTVEVRFTDGGHLRMTIATEYLDFVTAHGKLKIAVADIRRLDLATRISDADQRLIEKSIADLGSPEFGARDKASTELLALKEKAYPAVLKVSQSKDPEISKRAKELLEKIRAKVPAHRLVFRDRDIIFTGDSTISGKLELAALTATTQQFGPVQLKLADVAGIYFLAGGAETEVKLDGRYAKMQEVWLDTGLDLTEHVRLTITATGEIDMYATDGYIGQYVGTPKGRKAWPGNPGGTYDPGTLIGRVGDTGKVFVIKDQFDDSAPATGRLYLRAAGNPYNVQTTGQYSIKILGGLPSVGGAKTEPEAPPPPPDKAPVDKR